MISSAKRPRSDKLRKFIAEIPDLIYEGAKIKCVICKIPLMCWSRQHCLRHVNSEKHVSKRNCARDNDKFIFNLCVTFIACNIPFNLLDKEPFICFWNNYSECKLPSRTSLRRIVPSAREHIEQKIKSELKDQKLWLCVDETTDRKKHSVLNVMARKLEPHQSAPSILLVSKRIQQCTAEVISKLVLNTLDKFELSTNQLLMLVSDGAANMLSVGRSLKKHSANLLHITCKIHALNLVADSIRKCYPEVDALIAHTKAVFVKSPKRIREFHRLCPRIPEPPEPILTRWGTWLQAAFYYHKYFDNIKNVVLQFDTKEAAAIQKSQSKFQDSQVKMDLKIIHDNYFGLADAIEKLQNPAVPLEESLQIVQHVHAQLCAIEDAKNVSVLEKFESVFEKNSDFGTLRHICEGASTESLSYLKDYFTYANITSLDVERSFSAYKRIFSSCRTSFAETTVETYLMLQIFNRHYSLCDFTEDS